MIAISIPPVEGYDQRKQQFVNILPGGVFRFENSLVALSKWEEKHAKPFLYNDDLSVDERLDYYCEMCLDANFSKAYLSAEVVALLNEYVQAPHTATKIYSRNAGPSRKKVMTSEEIYAYMAILRIWKECDTWEINRLLTLIQCINILQNPDKGTKQNESDIAKEYEAINKQRLEQLKNLKGG